MNNERVKLDSQEAPAQAAHDAGTAAFTPGDTVETRIASPEAPPRSFGRYQLQKLLGQGGMGEVHLARDTLLERVVALKIPKFADDAPIHRERFLREARSAALLSHAHICPVYDVGEIEGKPYLTMAYIAGPSLSAHLRKTGPLEPRDAARLCATIALAMQHAHASGILHRDLKPANILLNDQGEPVIMDFGLAFRFDAQTSDRLTEQGLVVGTPAYMPPEQVNGQTLGPAADIYSLGVMLYEMLTGKVPFEGPLGKLLAQIDSAAPAPPRTLRPEIEPALESICLRALAKRPEGRFADMAAFAAALDDYVKGKATLQHVPMPTMMFRRPKKRWWPIVVGALAIAAAAMAATIYLMRETPAEPVAPPVRGEMEQQFEAMLKPLVKVEYELPEKALTLHRGVIPVSLLQISGGDGGLRFHDGPLYFLISGKGTGHVLDLSDQAGQAGQLTHFEGEITVRHPYLFFVGNVTDTSRIHIERGPGLCVLAPMNGGPGSRHVEFDGTHLLMPKIEAPDIETTDVTAAERAALRNRDLTKKTTWKYRNTHYVIFTRAGAQVVPGNHEQRKQLFPEIYDLIENDRRRQMNAPTIRKEKLQEALREAGK